MGQGESKEVQAMRQTPMSVATMNREFGGRPKVERVPLGVVRTWNYKDCHAWIKLHLGVVVDKKDPILAHIDGEKLLNLTLRHLDVTHFLNASQKRRLIRRIDELRGPMRARMAAGGAAPEVGVEDNGNEAFDEHYLSDSSDEGEPIPPPEQPLPQRKPKPMRQNTGINLFQGAPEPEKAPIIEPPSHDTYNALLNELDEGRPQEPEPEPEPEPDVDFPEFGELVREMEMPQPREADLGGFSRVAPPPPPPREEGDGMGTMGEYGGQGVRTRDADVGGFEAVARPKEEREGEGDDDGIGAIASHQGRGVRTRDSDVGGFQRIAPVPSPQPPPTQEKGDHDEDGDMSALGSYNVAASENQGREVAGSFQQVREGPDPSAPPPAPKQPGQITAFPKDAPEAVRPSLPSLTSLGISGEPNFFGGQMALSPRDTRAPHIQQAIANEEDPGHLTLTPAPPSDKKKSGRIARLKGSKEGEEEEPGTLQMGGEEEGGPEALRLQDESKSVAFKEVERPPVNRPIDGVPDGLDADALNQQLARLAGAEELAMGSEEADPYSLRMAGSMHSMADQMRIDESELSRREESFVGRATLVEAPRSRATSAVSSRPDLNQAAKPSGSLRQHTKALAEFSASLLAEKAATMPWLKPVVNAYLMTLDTLPHVRIQQENTKDFVRVITILELALRSLASAAGKKPIDDLDLKQSLCRDIAELLYEVNQFLTELTDRSDVWFRHLARAKEDHQAFRAFSEKFMSRAALLCASRAEADLVRKATEKVREEMSFALLFAQASDRRQDVVQQFLLEYSDVAEDMELVVQSESMIQEVRRNLELDATDSDIRDPAGTSLAAKAIRHPEARRIWLRLPGGGTGETADVDKFLKALETHLLTTEMPAESGVRLFERTGKLLKKDAGARKKLRALLDVDGDGRISVLDLNALFHRTNVALEDLLIELCNSPLAMPNNLELPPVYFSRHLLEGSAMDTAFASDSTSAVLVGPPASGKSTVAMAMARRFAVERSPTPLQGVFVVDATGRCTLSRLVKAILCTLRLPASISTPHDLVATLKARIKDVSAVLILDNMEDMLDKGNHNRDNALGFLRDLASIAGLLMVVTTTTDPGLKGFPAIPVPLLWKEEGLEVYAHIHRHRNLLAKHHAKLQETDLSLTEINCVAAAAAFDTDGSVSMIVNSLPRVVESIPFDCKRQLVHLSVFPSLFTQEAAEAVAHLKPWDLAELVRRGLIDARGGKFSMHPAVRRVVASLSEATSAATEHAKELMYAYAAERVRGCGRLFLSGFKETALAQFDAEWPTIDALVEHLAGAKRWIPIYVAIFECLGKSYDILEARYPTDVLLELFQAGEDLMRDKASSYPKVVAGVYASLGKVQRLNGGYESAHRRFAEYRRLLLGTGGDYSADLEFALSHFNSGSCLYALGKVGEAADEYRKCMEIRSRALGPDHPDVGAVQNAIGVCLRNTGRYGEAVEFFSKSLKIRLKTFGEESAEVAALRNNLGTAYRAMNNFKDAIDQHKRCLAIRSKLLGEDSAEVANSFNFLGHALFAQGDVKAALKQFARALEIRTRVLGEKHPQTLVALMNLGFAQRSLKDHNGAMQSFTRCLELRQAALGPDHIDVGVVLQNIGMTFQGMGQHEQSIEYFQRFHAIRARSKSPKPVEGYTPAMATGQLELSDADGSSSLAAQLQKSLEALVRSVGPDHPDVASLHVSIAEELQHQKRYEDAVAEYRKALRIRAKVLGERHADVAVLHWDIGQTLLAAGNKEEALQAMQQCVTVQRAALGDHVVTAKSIFETAVLLESLERTTEALDLFRQCVDMRTAALGPEHGDVAAAWVRVGSCQKSLRKFVDAVASFRKALAIQSKALGKEHPAVSDIYLEVGSCLQLAGMLSEAINFLLFSLKIRAKVYGRNHPAVAEAFAAAGSCYFASNEQAKALEYYNNALGIQTALHPEDPGHPDVLKARAAIDEMKNAQRLIQEELEAEEQARQRANEDRQAQDKLLLTKRAFAPMSSMELPPMTKSTEFAFKSSEMFRSIDAGPPRNSPPPPGSLGPSPPPKQGSLLDSPLRGSVSKRAIQLESLQKGPSSSALRVSPLGGGGEGADGSGMMAPGGGASSSLSRLGGASSRSNSGTPPPPGVPSPLGIPSPLGGPSPFGAPSPLSGGPPGASPLTKPMPSPLRRLESLGTSNRPMGAALPEPAHKSLAPKASLPGGSSLNERTSGGLSLPATILPPGPPRKLGNPKDQFKLQLTNYSRKWYPGQDAAGEGQHGH